jgi:hypothetical protein
MKEKYHNLFHKVEVEMDRQVDIWGIQNHYDVDPVLMERMPPVSSLRMSEEYEMPSPIRARQLCEIARRKNKLTWFHIALEEFTEIMDAATAEKEEDLKEEIVQMMSVLGSWYKAIEARSDPKPSEAILRSSNLGPELTSIGLTKDQITQVSAIFVEAAKQYNTTLKKLED